MISLSLLRRALLGAVLVPFVATVPAHAGTVSLDPAATLLTYDGSSQADAITVARTTTTVTITDDTPGAVVTAPGCTTPTAASAVCPAPEDWAVVVLGEAGDDTLAVAGTTTIGVELDGGPGADHLHGGSGDDALDGGVGADDLDGGPGEDAVDYSTRTAPVTVDLYAATGNGEAGENDTLTGIEDLWGGSGDDTLSGNAGDNVFDGGLGADDMHGNGGVDEVDYSWRSTPITADLTGSAHDDGAAGEHDSISADMDGIFGGQGNDVLVGNSDDGMLFGGAGADVLSDTGGGQDYLDGGPGADYLAVRDRAQDTVDCGDASDTANADADDLLQNCETITHIDPPKPVVIDTIVSSSPTGYTRQTSLTVTFSANIPGSTFQCSIDRRLTPCTSPLTLANLAEGQHMVYVVATSPTGQMDTSGASAGVYVDRTAPTLHVTAQRACVSSKGGRVTARASDASQPQEIHLEAFAGSSSLGAAPTSPVLHVRVTRGQLKRAHGLVKIVASDLAGNVATKKVRMALCRR